MEDSKITLIVAHGHNIVRSGVCCVLNSLDHFVIIGEAKNGIEAVEKAEELLPDVMVIDESLSGFNAVELVCLIKKKSLCTKIVILTLRNEDRHYLGRILMAEADAFVSLYSPETCLINALNAVHRDKKFLCPVFSGVALETAGNKDEESDGYKHLTVREKTVLQFVAEGYGNKEIAHRLEISVSTIKNHKSRIMKKLNLRDSAGLILYSVRKGLIKP